MRYTIAEQISVVADRNPDRVAIEVIDGPSLTYGAMMARVRALADAIGEVQEGPNGPAVAVLMGNGHDALLAFLACQVVGAAAIPVNNRLAAPEVRYVVEDSGAGVLLNDAAHAEVAAAALDGLGCRSTRTDHVLSNRDDGPIMFVGSPDDVGVVFYTSGTTGFPKGAAITNEVWMLRLLWWGWEFEIASEDIMLVPGPIFHMGFSSLALIALMRGARLRIQPRFDIEVAASELRETCTWALLIPTMTTMLLEKWRDDGRRPHTAARRLLSSGAALSLADLEDALDAFPNADVFEAYGWTEGGWVTCEKKNRNTLVPHSVGWPAFGSDLLLLDDTQTEVATGEVGQIAARCPVPFSHYLNREQATADEWHGEYHLSGDVGRVLPDGRLQLLDRKVDMIVSGGENVYSAEVERVLLNHDGVRECVVIGEPHPKWGEAVLAVVAAVPGVVLDADEVRGHCRSQLAGYKCPKRVVVVEELPRNSMGKIEKFKVREAVTPAPTTH